MGSEPVEAGLQTRRTDGPLLLSDLIKPLLQREAAQLVDGQAGEQLDAPFQDQERFKEGFPFSIVRSFHLGRVRHAPVSGQGLAGPVGTLLGGCLVADGKDKIHRASSGSANSSQLLLWSPCVGMRC